METQNAIILGIVQGLTEFLPISSSGHLILTHSLFGSSSGGDLAFDAVLHFATALAVLVYFHKDVWKLVKGIPFLFVQGDLRAVRLWAIAAATIPAIVFGLLLEDIMATLFRNPLLVAGALVVGSAILWVGERMCSGLGQLTIQKGFFIGLFQSLALVPGMSRSGMAIAGGMMLGLSREEAARFGFLIAIPLLLGAGAKKMIDVLSGSDAIMITPVLVGAGAAFVVGLLTIHYLLRFVRTHSLMPFVWYRVALAVVIVVVVLL